MNDQYLTSLRDKCLLFNKYMIESGKITPDLISAYRESNNLIEKAYQDRRISYLEAASQDVDDQIRRHMPLQVAIEIKTLLKKEFNIDFNLVDKIRMKAINKILQLGKISNQYEYDLLLTYVDEISINPNQNSEIEKVNKLLIGFKSEN